MRRVRHEPPTFKELVTIAILAVFALIVVALTVGCDLVKSPTTADPAPPATQRQAWMADRLEHYARKEGVQIRVYFMPQVECPLVAAVDPTKGLVQVPAAAWTFGCNPPPVAVNVNADAVERYDLDYWNRVAAHEVCHVALRQCEGGQAVEDAANACAAGIVEGL